MTANGRRAAAHRIIVPGAQGPTCIEATSLARLRQPLACGLVGVRQKKMAPVFTAAAAGGSVLDLEARLLGVVPCKAKHRRHLIASPSI